MGYKHDENEMLAVAVELVLEEGLSNLTFGRLARRVGVADRSIVYYFPTKADLITRTVHALGGRLQSVLAEAFGSDPVPGEEVARRAWPVLASPEADPVFRVFFELVGLGAAGIAPFDELAPALMESWIDWVVPRVSAGNGDARAAAYAAVAILDGLLLLRATCGAEPARAAAVAMGLE